MSTEYRVTELSNPGLVSGRIDPKDVEGLINAIAADGWEFVALTAQGSVGVSLAIIAVFKREKI
jgi:hypothetical protein